MIRIQIVFSLILHVLIFANASSAEFSESILEKNNLFLRAGYSHLNENNLEGRCAFSAGGTLFVSRKVGFELEGRVNLTKNLYDSQQGLQSLGAGDLNLIGVNVSILYMSTFSKRFGLYLLAGAGYSFNNFSPEEEYSTLGFHIEESVDNSISFYIGTGLDFALFQKIALNLDIRYTISNAKGKWSVEDTLGTAVFSGTSETNLNALIFMLGIKFLI